MSKVIVPDEKKYFLNLFKAYEIKDVERSIVGNNLYLNSYLELRRDITGQLSEENKLKLMAEVNYGSPYTLSFVFDGHLNKVIAVFVDKEQGVYYDKKMYKKMLNREF